MAEKSSDQLAPLNIQQRTLLVGLEELLADGILCDITLQAEDKCVHVHKSVLAASSPYFRAMFTLNTCESLQKTVELHSIAGHALVDVIKFIYSGSVTVNEDNAQALVTAAHMMQIPNLVQHCEEFMCSALCVENCLEIFNFADFQNLETLKQSAEAFILEHFCEIAYTDSFHQMNASNLIHIFNSDELNVASEQMVYEAMISWVQYDLCTRKKDLILLILSVRLSLIGLSYLQDTVAREKLISENAFCSKFVSEMIDYKLGKTDNISCRFNVKPRFGMFSTKMIIFSGGAYSLADRAFSCFDPETKMSFYAIKQHPTFDFKFKIDLYKLIVTESDGIFFLGGIFYDDYHFEHDGGEAQGTVLHYNKKKNMWQPCMPMKIPRCGFAACCHKNKIYVFGGYRWYPRHPPLQEVAMYCTETDAWSGCDDMPLEAAHQAAAVYKDSAFLFGGLDISNQYLDIILEYSLTKDQWTLVSTEMPRCQAEATAITHEDMIIVLGGQSNAGSVSAVSIFHPQRSRWSHGQDFPEVRKFTSVTKGDDCIYVCGGVRQFISRSNTGRRSKALETKDLYRYDIPEDMWTKEARFIEYGSNYACVYGVVNSKMLNASDFAASA